jgi:DNA topoisomerase IB
MRGVRRVDCSAPGIRRQRRGRGFSYLDERTGEPVRDRETLERIRSLVIPPAWRDVWICLLPNGHLQAVGTDQAGRRQYLYHQIWRLRRGQAKFDHMLDFARALPDLRQRVAADLSGGELSRERVLACAVRLLDRRSYIDPRLFDRYRTGRTVAGALERVGEIDRVGEPAHQAIEQAVLELIEERKDEPLTLDLGRPA